MRKMYSLLVVPDSKLQVPRHDTLLLVVASRVTRELEDLGSKVLEDRREVDYGTKPSQLLPRNPPPSPRSQTSELEAVTHQVHQHRHAGRSCPSSGDGGHDRRGTEDQPWPSAIATS